MDGEEMSPEDVCSVMPWVYNSPGEQIIPGDTPGAGAWGLSEFPPAIDVV